MSISCSHEGHDFVCGMDTVDDVREGAFFCCATVVPTAPLPARSGSPRIFMIALSEMTVWCRTGMLTTALQTGHFPVLPAFDSLAVKWCPFGHVNGIGTITLLSGNATEKTSDGATSHGGRKTKKNAGGRTFRRGFLGTHHTSSRKKRNQPPAIFPPFLPQPVNNRYNCCIRESTRMLVPRWTRAICTAARMQNIAVAQKKRHLFSLMNLVNRSR